MRESICELCSPVQPWHLSFFLYFILHTFFFFLVELRHVTVWQHDTNALSMLKQEYRNVKVCYEKHNVSVSFFFYLFIFFYHGFFCFWSYVIFQPEPGNSIFSFLFFSTRVEKIWERKKKRKKRRERKKNQIDGNKAHNTELTPKLVVLLIYWGPYLVLNSTYCVMNMHSDFHTGDLFHYLPPGEVLVGCSFSAASPVCFVVTNPYWYDW